MSTRVVRLLDRPTPRRLSIALPWGVEAPRRRGRSRRILVTARWPVGGIRTHLLVNLPALTGAGYAITLVGPAEYLAGLREPLAGQPVDFVEVEAKGKRCPLWRAVRRCLREGPFDLVHSHGVTAAAHATLANLGVGVPHAVTLHEPLRDGPFRGWRGRLRRWVLARVLARARAVVTVSRDARDNLLEYFPGLDAPGRVLLTLPNGIEAARFEEAISGPDLRKQLGLDGGTPLIGFLGRFMPEKGFPLLLDALRRLLEERSLDFHLAAFGSGDYRREYQARVDGMGLAGHVTLLDGVADVRPVLTQLDLVVVPSLWEASSLVSMEAMALGVPVLGSDCPGLREVLRGTPSRTVRAGDVGALAAGLRESLAALWTAEARAFAAEARRRFDNARSAGKLVALAGSLAGRAA
jgi:glycosyltransferase involved in cell wall biosynthesis